MSQDLKSGFGVTLRVGSVKTKTPDAAELQMPSLCVDLDGTLVKSDTLVDSVLAMVRQNPRSIFSLPRWLLEGKAAFKRHVAESVILDVTILPYNRPLLEFLTQQHDLGRTLYLATAADHSIAERVADHLKVFSGVLASDGSTNLAGENKYAAFLKHFGRHFAYIGNATPDLPALTHCLEPMVANPSPGLLAGLEAAHVQPKKIFTDAASSLTAWQRALRLHQWAKNLLIFLPLVLAHPWASGLHRGPSRALGAGALIAFLSFGLCASATYITNDLLDLEADRHHPKKRRRPFAAGDLSAQSGVIAAVVMLASSLILAWALPHIVAGLGLALLRPYRVLVWLLIYAASTTAYSFQLKRIVLVDVITLSGLYTIRIIAGSAATGIFVSAWLAGFSVFFFLSLAFVKRFAELESLRLQGKTSPTSTGRGYRLSDIEQLRSLGTSSAYASVVVLTLYISNLDTRLYHHPGRLWFLIPVFLLWVSQLWLLASRGELNEDPVVYAISDRRSLLLGALVLCVILSAL